MNCVEPLASEVLLSLNIPFLTVRLCIYSTSALISIFKRRIGNTMGLLPDILILNL